eukprot:TRINITY_DN3871_c0_g1_i2.p1 TRINITY_DN3871_c0_g1~~TRINITY_DN3871_c0_g1_i2.p1  ORF type:complete len:107 (+),score=21.28 TRINITY_DN3871_c0_g1_i2:115-435(+)
MVRWFFGWITKESAREQVNARMKSRQEPKMILRAGRSEISKNPFVVTLPDGTERGISCEKDETGIYFLDQAQRRHASLKELIDSNPEKKHTLLKRSEWTDYQPLQY